MNLYIKASGQELQEGLHKSLRYVIIYVQTKFQRVFNPLCRGNNISLSFPQRVFASLLQLTIYEFTILAL